MQNKFQFLSGFITIYLILLVLVGIPSLIYSFFNGTVMKVLETIGVSFMGAVVISIAIILLNWVIDFLFLIPCYIVRVLFGKRAEEILKDWINNGI